jgi:transcriptional regulator with XRE-family HTH domain
MTDYRVRIGESIARQRRARRWSQRELAVRAGVATDGTISRWERGVSLPTPEHVAALERAFGLVLGFHWELP